MPPPDPACLTRIVIADSQAVIRLGVRLAIEEQRDMHVVGEACDAASALTAVAATNPDVAVLELELDPLGPLRLMQRFGAHSNVRLVLLSGTDDAEIVEAALAGGARAIVSKNSPIRSRTICVGSPSIVSNVVRKESCRCTTPRRLCSSAARFSLPVSRNADGML